jgi:subtilisin family serine protease
LARIGAPVVAVLVAATALIVSQSPARSAPAPGGPAARAPRAAAPTSITLITGDRVALTAAGAPASIVPGPGRGSVYFQRLRDAHGHVQVIPSDALPLLAAGRLDRRLFDVTALAEQGYTDDRMRSLPLLVAHPPGVAAPAASKAGGTTVRRELPTLGFTALAEPRDRAGEFWRSVRGPRPRALAGGLTKVWLDGRVHASLDQSVPQIGAPAVWATGDRGAGVTVAVLDSGYADHPDLAGAVTRARGFTDAGPGDVTDRWGHGTHVASIVAGRGTASGGRYTGVAPAAALAVGKVLGDDGSGLEDWVIAGMQWAAVDLHAKVINLSLGGAPTDGTDPASQALDQLSRQTGALFVVAAGNEGADASVESPGSADEALTVGSVTKSDALSDFSSRGPRLGDDAIKPDLVAPGQDIVAARAAGTPVGDEDPVDGSYSRLSGTSMATPHMAGAAALLAQRHPEWTGPQLKAALLAGTTVLPGQPVYAQGAGRLDIAAAVAQPLTVSTGSLSLGRLTWPYRGTPARTGQLTFGNGGDSPVTLALALDVTDAAGAAPPAGMLRLSPATLAVPAHGSATATVTLDPDAAATGLYGGRLTATPAGGAPLHVSVGASVEAESYDLTLHAVARTGGAPPASELIIADQDDPSTARFAETGPDGTITLRVPRGRYRVAGFLAEPVAGDATAPLTAVARVGIAVGAPTDVVLDARVARPVTVAVGDEPTARLLHRSQTLAVSTGTKQLWDTVDLDADIPFYAQAGAVPGVRFDTHTTWARPDATLTVAGGTAIVGYRNPTRPALGTRDYPIVDGGLARPDDLAGLDVRGKLVLLRYDFDNGGPDDQVKTVAAAGAAGALFPDFTGLGRQIVPGIPMLITDDTAFTALANRVAAGPVTGRLTVNPPSAFSYQLDQTERGRLPGGVTYRVDRTGLARVDARYRSLGGPGDVVSAAAPLEVLTDAIPQWVTASLPTSRVEYYTPGRWSAKVSFDGLPFTEDARSETDTYQAGQAYRRDWNVAVIAPKLAALPGAAGEPGLPAVSRTGDTVTAIVAALSDAVDGRTGSAAGFGDSGDLTLRRDGTDLGGSGNPNGGAWDVPAGTADYELRQTVRRNRPGWGLSTTVETSWTFRSGHVAGPAALPLLEVGYAVPLDENNAMPAARPTGFGLTVTPQAGAGPATIATVQCEVSYDDGGSWQRLAVHRVGSGWRVDPPAGGHPGGHPGGYASLRVTATGPGGASVRQTVVRAFALR